jgi:Integrase zinc binding domain
MFSKIIAHPDAHKKFGIQDGRIWRKNRLRRDIVCMPQNVFHRGRRMIEIIIDHTHQTVGQYSQLKTSNYIRRAYWWPSMATDIELFCTLCAKCQTNKMSMQLPKGLLHSLPTLDRPWQLIGIDFMVLGACHAPGPDTSPMSPLALFPLGLHSNPCSQSLSIFQNLLCIC